jgi:hypothetical protein
MQNAPLWNPSSKDLINVEGDEAGRLAGFRARFRRGFDAGREPTPSTEVAGSSEGSSTKAAKIERVEPAGLEGNGFAGEEVANLLDLISLFEQESGARSHKKGDGKK